MPKSFWRKYEFAIVAVATLLFVYLIAVFNQNISFLLGNDLIVNLAPQQISFNLNYGNAGKAEFNVSIDNVFYCKASCSYSFNDRSRSEVVDNGSFEIEAQQHVARAYELSSKRLGSGQDIYSFDIRCRSMRSFLCLTKSPEKLKSSLAIVNYDLTETEKELKKLLKQNVTHLLEILAEVDVAYQQANQKYFELAHRINLNNLSRQKTAIDDEHDKLIISIENLRSLWSVEDYAELSRMFAQKRLNQSLFEILNSVNNSITILDRNIDSIADLHKSLLLKLNFLSTRLNGLGSFAGMLEDDRGNESGEAGKVGKAGNNEAFKGLNSNVLEFHRLFSSLVNNTLEDYGEFSEEVEALSENVELIIKKSVLSSTEMFLNYDYTVNYENAYLCSLKQDCKENISVFKIAKNAEEFIKNYPDASSLRQDCGLLMELGQKYERVRNETAAIILERNISYSSNASNDSGFAHGFIAIADIFRDNEIRKLNNSYYRSLQEIISEPMSGNNKTEHFIIKILSSLLPANETGLVPHPPNLSYNESLNISLYLLSKINLSDTASALISKCSKINDKKEIVIFDVDLFLVSKNITYKDIKRIDTNLSDNPPICCVFKDCKPCCRDNSCINEPKTFPIIFLHGHSFSKDNSPEFSLDSFNQLQSKLQEDGYLNAGTISLYSKNEPQQAEQAGIWGLSGKPVTVKASYYYDAFRREDRYIVIPTKSESIDTYSLRLKDLIELVKKRTNKPKVNIIAHSMGGLVARKYLQIFGEEDIDKLIMIATPNKGISGKISEYCGLLGENRECMDMQENSLFINKLNEPLRQPRQPSDVRLYSIAGKGCQMNLGDGDGIVLAENAKLENARLYFIDGVCDGFGRLLHTDILDIEMYPDVYRTIKDIINE